MDIAPGLGEDAEESPPAAGDGESGEMPESGAG